MRRLLAEHPLLNQYLLNKLIGMVRSNTANVKSLALGDVHQRVVRLLSSLEGTSVGGRRVLYERMTHREIAERIGCSREMVSRVIKQLEREGHIITGNRRFALRKVKAPQGCPQFTSDGQPGGGDTPLILVAIRLGNGQPC